MDSKARPGIAAGRRAVKGHRQRLPTAPEGTHTPTATAVGTAPACIRLRSQSRSPRDRLVRRSRTSRLSGPRLATEPAYLCAYSLGWRPRMTARMLSARRTALAHGMLGVRRGHGAPHRAEAVLEGPIEDHRHRGQQQQRQVAQRDRADAQLAGACGARVSAAGAARRGAAGRPDAGSGRDAHRALAARGHVWTGAGR